MSYDDKLGARVIECLQRKRDITRKKMFGGLCFLLHGNMLCGIVGDKLVARVRPDAYEELLTRKHVEPMTFTGKPMKGMLYILPGGTRTRSSLEAWLSRSMEFVKSLPRKQKA